MRIVIYSPNFPPIIDGTSVQAKRLFDLLKKQHKVFALSYSVNRDIKYDRKLLNIKDEIERIKPIFVDRKNKFPTLDGENIIKKIEYIQPEIIHIRGWYQLNVVEKLIDYGTKNKISIIWHCDGLHECHNNFKKDISYNKLLKKAINSKIIFVGQTKYDYKILFSLGVKKELFFLIPPIIPEVEKFILKDWNKPVVLSVGRFFNYKNHEVVVDSIKTVNSDVDVIIAGATDNQDSNRIIKKIKNRCTLLLDPSEKILMNTYRCSTHFILASTRETLGIVALEALKYGLIPIVRKNFGIQSYLPKSLLFNSKNELVRKIKNILIPINAKRISIKLGKVIKHLNNEEILRSYNIIYKNI
jgi:glycosyltransferase involved in cell wall biosynthesis